MTDKHTPGPWKIGFSDGSGAGQYDEGIWIVAEGNNPIVRGGQDQGVPVGVVTPADARLIAATPALLEALESVLFAERKHDGHINPDNPCWCQDARTAIKAAKGSA